MGVTILIKPAMLGFPFIVAAAVFLTRGKGARWGAKAALYVLAAYLAMTPWVVRNYVVLHAFVPVATHGGTTFWGGTGPADGICLGNADHTVDSVERNLYTNPLIPKVSEKTYQKIIKFQERLSHLNEVQADAECRREAFREIEEHPGRYAFLAVKKFFRLWFNLWHDYPASIETVGIAVVNAILILLAILGYKRARLDEYFRQVAVTTCVYTSLVYMAVYAVVRYSYPVMPLIIMLAAAYVDLRICGKLPAAAGEKTELSMGVQAER